MTDRGQLFILSAPSGAGKTTLRKYLCEAIPLLSYSVSCTTRKIRPGEVEGRDYHFISRAEFTEGIKAGRFAEWAEVHGNLYGTSAEFIRQELEKGARVILDIDVAGAKILTQAFPDAVTIFVRPPSMEALRERLTGRGTDDADTVEKRLVNAEWEMAHKEAYRHVLVNDDLEKAKAELFDLVSSYIKSSRTADS
ncbi:MAG: guanylate kinase [Deltaproteobacteria bacterium]|nr:guanylate kinase [Deltaproteobacteria bacterium]